MSNHKDEKCKWEMQREKFKVLAKTSEFKLNKKNWLWLESNNEKH